MDRQTTLLVAAAIVLAACAEQPTKHYAGAIKHAKNAGRSLVIFGIHHGSPSVNRTVKGGYLSSGLSAGVAFIPIRALQSVSFDFLPYSAGSIPQHRKIKRFTAQGPLRPNRAYQFVGPKIVWPELSTGNCLMLVGMVSRRADGKVIHVNKDNIDQYLTSNVATRCIEIAPVVP